MNVLFPQSVRGRIKWVPLDTKTMSSEVMRTCRRVAILLQCISTKIKLYNNKVVINIP